MSVQPSEILKSTVVNSIKGKFNEGILLKNILFVSQVNFIKGEYNFVGF